jgi:hypothetical protein
VIIAIVLLMAFKQQTIFWSDDFEDNLTSNEYVDVWTCNAGIPICGPDSDHGVQNCAVTVLKSY